MALKLQSNNPSINLVCFKFKLNVLLQNIKLKHKLKVKFKVILFGIVLSMPLMLMAQEAKSTASNFWFGPKFGLDLSTSTSDVNSLSNQLSSNYQAGLFLQFGKRLYLQPEFYYATYVTNANTGTSLNYFKAPILFGFKIFDIGLISLHIDAGPSLLQKLNDNTAKPVINLQAGTGINLLGFITADLRYTLKRSNVSGSVAQVETLINNGGMVNLTVGLRLR